MRQPPPRGRRSPPLSISGTRLTSAAASLPSLNFERSRTPSPPLSCPHSRRARLSLLVQSPLFPWSVLLRDLRTSPRAPQVCQRGSPPRNLPCRPLFTAPETRQVRAFAARPGPVESGDPASRGGPRTSQPLRPSALVCGPREAEARVAECRECPHSSAARILEGLGRTKDRRPLPLAGQGSVGNSELRDVLHSAGLNLIPTEKSWRAFD